MQLSTNHLNVTITPEDSFLDVCVTGIYDQDEIQSSLSTLTHQCMAHDIFHILIDSQNLGGFRTSTGGLLFAWMFEAFGEKFKEQSGKQLKVAFLRDEDKILPHSPEFNVHAKSEMEIGVFTNRDQAVSWLT